MFINIIFKGPDSDPTLDPYYYMKDFKKLHRKKSWLLNNAEDKFFFVLIS
jgi:hypothetical protein